jgi:MSHA pilin protein MshD
MIRQLQSGVTLVELIASIAIITVAIGGITLLFVGTTSTSADPMIRVQQLSIAQSYMDEIFMQAYANPSAACPVTPGAERQLYDDICDYNNLNNTGVIDQYGNPIPSLSNYNVSVSVEQSSLQGLDAKKITVTVSHNNAGAPIPITAYRMDY